MFDSWIQRQAVLNANKENVSTQPRKVILDKNKQHHQVNKVTFGSKIKSTSEQKVLSAQVNPVKRKEVQKPVINLKNLGGNIKMIKSNTCENEGIEEKSMVEHYENDESLENEF